jgi:IS5 family transposase
MLQYGLFDHSKRLVRIDKAGDPLVQLNKVVDWEQFRELIEMAREKPRKSNAGAKGYDTVLLFSILILQALYNLPDEAMEFQMLDRYSFSRFLDITQGAKVPDATTIFRFREDPAQADVIELLFTRFDQFPGNMGLRRRRDKFSMQVLSVHRYSVVPGRKTRI